jgi:hypothetical protein
MMDGQLGIDIAKRKYDVALLRDGAGRSRPALRLADLVEESYKRMKDELGWADFIVPSDRAIRRHWAAACCAFAFC